ncbi:putative beta-D-xylosidase 2 [Ananas comosus]|uniref:Putative beta-D-xylosidase 2 n=1 Tax=Ananas comosus TaxID=4615 RepID=A0A199UCR3_ANACO|nr:putative beta-D-xylosidase 2 [Ananas comosus]
MASSSLFPRLLFLLLSFTLYIPPSSSSRSVPPATAAATAATPAALAPGLPPYKPGPITTNGKNYTKACDPARFADLGLDMADFLYCNSSLGYAERVRDLVGRMTLVEKIANLGDRAQGAARIGLPKYGWWSEALHGVASTGHATYFGDVVPAATSFPNVILTAAAFNETLWKAIAQAISTEGRAMYNLGHTGLTFWSPNINVARDPRWGRVLETPGEDPYTVGRYSVNFVRGMQDVQGSETTDDPHTRPLKVSTCCKHYAAYDLDNWFGVTRFDFDSRVTQQDMVETFIRPFETCVREGDSSSIMCSFNRINGIPVCADPQLMSQTFRDDWQLHGYIVSDCDSIEVIYERQKWLNGTPEEAVARVMKAGLDLDCGYGPLNYYMNFTESAVKQGLVRESDIDNALKNLYMLLMRVGFFDNIPAFEPLGTNDICTEEKRELAVDAARQAIVLLKNDDNTLPLDASKYKSIALVGPHANATEAMIGNYAGIPCRYLSPLDAFSTDADSVEYVQACDVKCTNDSLFGPAVAAAKNASATFIFVGLDLSIEAEERDRMDLLLPGSQTELVNKVADASAGPVILVILSGSCLDVSFAHENPKIGAIIWAGYPGGEGGQAIADVVFGRYNPGGKLPITWYKNEYIEQIPMTSMPLRPVDEFGYPGRTYKFFNGTALYPFGYGLSYSNYTYGGVRCFSCSVTISLDSTEFCKPLSYKEEVNASTCPALKIDELPCKETIEFDVGVTNHGTRGGSNVVIVYSKPPAEVADAPLKQVVGYQRVFVPAGGTAKVHFSLNACKALGLVEKTAYTVLPSGTSTIVVGDGDVAVSFPVEVQFQL